MTNKPINATPDEVVEAIKKANIYHEYSGPNKCTLEKTSFEVTDDEPLECTCRYYDRMAKALSTLPTIEERVEQPDTTDALVERIVEAFRKTMEPIPLINHDAMEQRFRTAIRTELEGGRGEG